MIKSMEFLFDTGGHNEADFKVSFFFSKQM